MVADAGDVPNLDWFAVDNDDHLGRFTSLDVGFIPAYVKDNFTDQLRLSDYLGDLNRRTGCDGGYGLEGTEHIRTATEFDAHFLELAEWIDIGIFSFIADRSTRATGDLHGYKKIAWPHQPIKVSTLEKEFRKILRSVCIDANFAAATGPIERDQILPTFNRSRF